MAEVSKEYKTISQIAGPLVFVKKTEPIAYGELVSVRLSDGQAAVGDVARANEVPKREGHVALARPNAEARLIGRRLEADDEVVALPPDAVRRIGRATVRVRVLAATGRSL